MSVTPTFRLTGTGGTVILECRHGAEQPAFPTQLVPIQVRKKLDSDDTGGFTNVLKSFYTLAGQTQTTSHRLITSAQHALLSSWHQDMETISYTWSGGTHDVVIKTYEPRPKNKPFRHATEVTVDNLTLLFV